MRSPLRSVACVVLTATAACAQSPAPADPRLWTLFSDEALYAGGATAAQALAAGDGLPGGIPLGLIVDGATLTPRTALADGGSVTFLTTEVWANYSQVWMQPAYVPITGWAADGTPQKLLGGDGVWHPIFSVGPQSGFYSPFWQIVYALVPAGTAPEALTSSRQVLDGGYPLTPAEGRTMPLAPDGVTGGGAPGTSAPASGKGWLDGSQVSFLDFGAETFAWDATTNVVQPAPIYVLTLTGPDGAAHALPSIPTVLGDTPPGSGDGQPLRLDGQWRFSAYWSVHTIALPPGARVFAPPGSQVARDLAAQGLQAGTYTAGLTGADPSTYASYEGLVALDAGDGQGTPGCFDAPADLPGCDWLDSEEALRQLDPSAEAPTALTVSWEAIGVAEAIGGASAPVEVLP